MVVQHEQEEANVVIDSNVAAIAIAVIAAIPGTIAAILSARNANAIKDVHLSLNSRLDQLLTASVDKGRIAERTEQRLMSPVENTETK